MYSPHFQITPNILKNIEEIGHAFGYIQAVQLPESYRQEFIEKIAAETVHASTAIEGNTLTQDQVEKVIRGNKIHAIERDIKEAKNYYEALEHIREVALNTEKFTQHTILELHKRLLSGVDDVIAGKYRRDQVRVGDYFPPEPSLIPRLMMEFVTWIDQPFPQGLSHIIYAGIAHYQLVAIHPFRDGNGRTSRAFITLYLMKNGYDITGSFALESYYNRERKAYYNALSTADHERTKDGQLGLTFWLEYFTSGFLTEAQRAQSRIVEFLNAQESSNKISLTATQEALLRILAEKGTTSIGYLQEKLCMGQGGVYKALQKLISLEFVTQSGERKGRRYTITKKGLQDLK